MKLTGSVHRFEDSINTDYIISGRYKFRIQDPHELAKHLLEDLKPEFYKTIKQGDFIVAGANFGCGSSREQAPIAIKYSGISAVIAKSFARIFFRNAINLGLILIECDTSGFRQSDTLQVDTAQGHVVNVSTGQKVKITPLPDFMTKIIEDGGIVEHFKKHGDFKF
ncbi:MAG: 3-isopropylmalate dehydratase small subunit [Candidatus Omnitrophica bacterium]|nr:3-isopropylmalate dehydratase small subunit [Candidatus Omnitrophota bacterium]